MSDKPRAGAWFLRPPARWPCASFQANWRQELQTVRGTRTQQLGVWLEARAPRVRRRARKLDKRDVAIEYLQRAASAFETMGMQAALDRARSRLELAHSDRDERPQDRSGTVTFTPSGWCGHHSRTASSIRDGVRRR